jgi:hypothetical protein
LAYSTDTRSIAAEAMDYTDGYIRCDIAVLRCSYEYFNQILTEKLELFGLDRIADEKSVVEDRTKFWFNECVDQVKSVDKEAAKRKKIYSNQVSSQNKPMSKFLAKTHSNTALEIRLTWQWFSI